MSSQLPFPEQQLPASDESAQIDTPPKKRAAVIDDAFDDVQPDEISIDKYLEFYQIANQEGTFTELADELGIVLPDVYAGGETPKNFVECLQVLWDRREEPELKEVLEVHLFANKIAKLNELESICQNLEQQDLDIKRINSKVPDPNIFSSGEFIYIFIDYNLGVIPGTSAIANAKNKAREIYNMCPKGKKPVTILMSSEPGDPSLVERFREEAGMIEGVFRFSPKEQLGDENKVSLLVRAFAQEFENNHTLQDYIHALIEAAKSALKEFEKEVRMLRIEDYVFIQDSALRDQAQPLGDYLAWLYGTHWANLLLRNSDLRSHQDIIDKVFSDKPLLHHRLPSPKVSDIYMSALFEEGLGALKHHPLEGPAYKYLAKFPYLHLGDLFTKTKSTEVWMVLNAQCDLERLEAKDARRSIFLVQGTLIPFSKQIPKDEPKTEFFLFESSQYRIWWNVKQVETVPLDQFSKWQSGKGVDRNYRLRLPFALEIQQAFSASITRVGMPVSPPFTEEIILEVLYKNEDGSIGTLLPASTEYAFFPVTRTGDKLVRLTLHFALDFKDKLLSKKGELLIQKSLSEDGHFNTYQKKLFNNIKLLLDTFDDWFFQSKGLPFPIPPMPKQTLLLPPSHIALTLDIPGGQFSGQNAFIINVKTASHAEIIEVGKPVSSNEN